MSDASAIPDDAELLVTPLTDKTKGYDYDAYMSALNAKAGKAGAYTDANTLLYDIAFMKDGQELQPETGTVSVSVQFRD